MYFGEFWTFSVRWLGFHRKVMISISVVLGEFLVIVWPVCRILNPVMTMRTEDSTWQYWTVVQLTLVSQSRVTFCACGSYWITVHQRAVVRW